MASIIDGGNGTFVAGAAIAKHILVKLSSGKLAVAGLGEEPVGTLNDASFADGDVRSVALRSKQGTLKCVAAGGFTAGAVVYGRADGKVDDVSSSSAIRIGIALETATNANDIVEVMPG